MPPKALVAARMINNWWKFGANPVTRNAMEVARPFMVVLADVPKPLDPMLDLRSWHEILKVSDVLRLRRDASLVGR